jgi:hypothetical protein
MWTRQLSITTMSLRRSVGIEIGRDHGGDLYVFRSRSGSLIKIHRHDGIGMSLWAKRLERGSFGRRPVAVLPRPRFRNPPNPTIVARPEFDNVAMDALAMPGITNEQRSAVRPPHGDRSPPQREKPILQRRLDLKFADGLPDGRLLVRRFNTAKQGGGRPLYVIDAPRVPLARWRRRRRLLLGRRALHRVVFSCRPPVRANDQTVHTIRGPMVGTGK